MTTEERENAIRCLKLWIEREPYLQTYKICLEALEQEPFMNKPCVAHQVCHEDKVKVLDKIKGYIDHIRNTGMGKKKSLEFIEKFIEGLKGESEDV